MRVRLAGTTSMFGLLALCWACSGTNNAHNTASDGSGTGGGAAGGAASSSGGVAGDTSSGGGGSGSGGHATEELCASEASVRDPGSTETWAISVHLLAGANEVRLAKDLVVGDLIYQFTEAKFYLAEPTLARTDGTKVPAVFVDAEGKPSAYNVRLIDASDPTSLDLAIAAPPGPYAKLELGFGLSPACNRLDPTAAGYPLSLDTGMFWAWGTQYKFLLLHGSFTGGSSAATLAQELGFDVSYKRMSWPLAEGTTAELAPAQLRVDLHEFMSPPEGETFESTNHTFVPAWALNKLDTTIFQLSPVENSP